MYFMSDIERRQLINGISQSVIQYHKLGVEHCINFRVFEGRGSLIARPV